MPGSHASGTHRTGAWSSLVWSAQSVATRPRTQVSHVSDDAGGVTRVASVGTVCGDWSLLTLTQTPSCRQTRKSSAMSSTIDLLTKYFPQPAGMVWLAQMMTG